MSVPTHGEEIQHKSKKHKKYLRLPGLKGCIFFKSGGKYNLGKHGGDIKVVFTRSNSSERVDMSSTSSRLSLPTQVSSEVINDPFNSLTSASQSSKTIVDVHFKHDGSEGDLQENILQPTVLATSHLVVETQLPFQTPLHSTDDIAVSLESEPTNLLVKHTQNSNTITTKHGSEHITRSIGFQLPASLETQGSTVNVPLPLKEYLASRKAISISLNSFNVSDTIQKEHYLEHDHETEDSIAPLSLAVPKAYAVSSVPVLESQIRVKEAVQLAAYKRSFSRNSKTGFIVDVPEVWGIGPDGSAMETFNKADIKIT